MEFEYADASKQWFEAVFKEHKEEARSRALSLVSEGTKTVTGCIETPTKEARKVRFKERQMPAYRFICCIQNEVVSSFDDVVRHRCNNRRCINLSIWNWGHAGRTCRTSATLLPMGWTTTYCSIRGADLHQQ